MPRRERGDGEKWRARAILSYGISVANMASDELVECPACGRPIDPDVTSCPACGADFTMHGIDELERMARALDAPEASDVDASGAAAVQPAEAGRPGRKRGLFSRLFGRS